VVAWEDVGAAGDAGAVLECCGVFNGGVFGGGWGDGICDTVIWRALTGATANAFTNVQVDVFYARSSATVREIPSLLKHLHAARILIVCAGAPYDRGSKHSKGAVQ